MGCFNAATVFYIFHGNVACISIAAGGILNLLVKNTRASLTSITQIM